MRTERITATEGLSASECWALLRSTDVGRLAMSFAGRQEIFPLNYVVDHGTVVFRTGEGTKLAAATERLAVAFEVDGLDVEPGEVWSVVIKGTVEEVKRVDELMDVVAALPLYPWHAAPKGHFLRIVPGEITGRRFALAGPETWAKPAGRARPVHE
jgi:nitroimidazol reductase NimA-like FMN-containing flavoprotein (pyridoxamine 5'-phosphate oxidase superfamily)